MKTDSPLAVLGGLLDHLPIGVVLLDAAGRVLGVNAYERRLAGKYAADAVGRDFFAEVAPCLDLRGLGGAFRLAAAGGDLRDVNIEAELSFEFEHLPKPRDVRLSIQPFTFGGETVAAVCLQDITEFRENERHRDVLAATTVHDLKTPLATVSLELETALRMLGDPDRARMLIESAQAGVARASRMAATLLDVQRLARAAPTTADSSRLEVDLVCLSDATLGALRPLARAQNVTLSIEGDGAAPLLCDAGLVRRALENLLDNAIRNAPDGSTVTTVVAREPDGARVAVVDHGPGVPAERRRSIFEAGDSTAPNGWNFGLGLTLVALVAERHDGRAWVEETPGGGATFVLALQG